MQTTGFAEEARTLITSGADRRVANRSFELDLGGLRFDPLTDFPALPSDGHHLREAGPNFRLVQFSGPIRPEWLRGVRDQGIEVVQYIHPFTYVVWADAARLDAARGLPGVRWTGELAVEFRVLPGQRERDSTIVPTMSLISRHADESSVRDELAAAGAVVRTITALTSHTSVVFLEVAGDRYLELGRIPAVYTVQFIPPEAATRGEMSNQSIVGNFDTDNTIFTGYVDWLTDTGYDGTGAIVGVVDGGIRFTHQDLADRIAPCVLSGDVPTSCLPLISDHGTHVAGAVAGTGATGTTDGADFLRGQGVAPGAMVVPQTFLPFLGAGPDGMMPDGMLKIYRESALSGALLTNNSWGPTGTPQGYDIPTQQVDMITRDADPETPGHQPVLPVWSIMNGSGDSGGNCAPSSLGSPDEAKNLFAVGSTWLQTPAGAQMPDIFDVSSNSAHGPACDGRIVPHVVAPGCRTDSATALLDTSHGLLCGTSMASPVVSGAVSVFIERYRDLQGANPSPALIKAAFIAVAMNLHGFRNADGDVITETPSRFQGYGRIDLDAVANPPDNVLFFDQEMLFTESGQSWSVRLAAEDPGKPVRVMLVWTDAPGHGMGGTTPAWVNDLDLAVEADTSTYLGNQLGPDGFSQTGGEPDGMNNTEGVFLRPDQHDDNAFRVTVSAANLAGDALNPHDPGDHPSQDFALVCYNCELGRPLAPVLTFDPSSLEFGDVEVGTTSPALSSMLENSGNADATGLIFSLAGSSDFEADTSACGETFSAGESCQVSVTFAPAETGPAEATLTVTSDQDATADLTLTGNGVAEGEGFAAMALEVDPDEMISDGNRVFEPGETVVVAPAWRNDDAVQQELQGTASSFSGPDGADYTILIDKAEYGLLDPGQTASCVETGVCYQMGVNDPAVRPATHWDATFEETLSDETTKTKTWTLHLGDSYVDAPRASPFYRFVETLLHNQVTGGCTATEYCPVAETTRGQMPVFVLRALEGPDFQPPACVEGEEVFADVPATSPFCPWIQELFVREVVAGCDAESYCPNDAVNRQQMAVFLLATLGGPGFTPPPCSGIFTDVVCPSPFADWVEELFDREITGGCATDPLRYCPTNPVNRQQMAVFVAATFGLTLYGP